jgi:hypothetical protein
MRGVPTSKVGRRRTRWVRRSAARARQRSRWEFFSILLGPASASRQISANLGLPGSSICPDRLPPVDLPPAKGREVLGGEVSLSPWPHPLC